MTDYHTMQYMNPRPGEPLPYGPQRESLHPSTSPNRYESAPEGSCAYCDHLRLEVAPTPIHAIWELYEGNCIKDGLAEWRPGWTERTCAGWEQAPLPVRIYPAPTEKMMRDRIHHFCIPPDPQTKLTTWEDKT